MESIDLLQKAYLELSKYVFVPFLYGFELNSATNSKIYKEVVDHLEKVKDNLIEAPYDISDIIKAVFDLAESLNSSDMSDSSYIHKKVDRFVMLSKAESEEIIRTKENVLKDIKIFKKKKDFMTRDPEADDYFTTFMRVIKNGYNTCERINKGIFKLTTEEGESKFMKNAESCLDLIPVSGIVLRKHASKRFVNDYAKNQIKIKAMNSIYAFNHKEIEEIIEFTIVSFLYKYKDYFR